MWVAAIATTFVLSGTDVVRSADPPTLARLLAAAGEHVLRFEQAFALVVSDEDYEQQGFGRYLQGAVERGQSPLGDGNWNLGSDNWQQTRSVALHRSTRAEMLFMWLPDEAAWLTVRNVLTLDGRAVPGSQRRLDEAFRDAGSERVTRLRRLVDESARFNLGRTFRNYNYPTQVLSYLDPAMQPRFTFKLSGLERVVGVDAWKVTYDERARPTVIQGDGADRRSKGAVWIADRDGTVVRTTLELMIPTGDALASDVLEVNYKRDSKLDMWVPVHMSETYIESRGSLVTERLRGEARYSNFRRFETSARVLEPR
jgi:hypothetical protein